MKIEVKKKELGGLLKAGDHQVTVTEAGIVFSKENPNWTDLTPQLKVIGKNEKGQITAWMNLRGYKNISDFDNGIAPKGHEFRSFDDSSEKFLCKIGKDGKATRVVSEERTAKLLENVGNLAFAIGFEDELDSDDLEPLTEALYNAEVGVRVRENANGRTEAHYFMAADEVAVA